MTTTVLLGAGASAEAGIPMSFAMTERLVSRVAARRWDKTTQALHFVCGAIVAHDSAEGASPYTGLDVERVFAAVELLAERRTLEVSPFVASWHPAVEEWDRHDIPPRFDRRLAEALLTQPAAQSARDLILELVRAVTGPGNGEVYRDLAQRLLVELRALLVVQPKALQYMYPLVDLGRRETGLTIATLNYDLGVELACATRGVPIQTGIDRWIADKTWPWAPSGIRLLKLHGSIDWTWEDIGHQTGALPRRTLEVSHDPVSEQGQPGVVFGNRGKLKAAGPFLSLLAEFESQLSRTEQLVVIGYSFRDDHVNEAITQWTFDGVSRSIIIVDPHFPGNERMYDRDDFRTTLRRHLSEASTPTLEVWRVEASEGIEQLAARLP